MIFGYTTGRGLTRNGRHGHLHFYNLIWSKTTKFSKMYKPNTYPLQTVEHVFTLQIPCTCDCVCVLDLCHWLLDNIAISSRELSCFIVMWGQTLSIYCSTNKLSVCVSFFRNESMLHSFEDQLQIQGHAIVETHVPSNWFNSSVSLNMFLQIAYFPE